MLMKRAGEYLARRPHGRLELKRKLVKFAKPEEIELVLDRLERLNLLNDLDYAYNFALRRIQQKGWSLEKARGSLLRLQIAPENVESSLERVRNELKGEPNAELAICAYTRKRGFNDGLPSDAKGVKRLIAHLQYRGFDSDEILNALKGKVPDVYLQRFLTGD
jgi:SOS response regulatory protein OraA/RecX